MTGDTAIRLALGAALGLGLALAVGIIITGTRGDSPPPSPTTPTAAAGQRTVGVEDALVLTRIRPAIREWNAASDAWVRALSAGRETFARRYAALTRRMDRSSLRIRLTSSRIADPRLRALLRRLGDVYRKQLRAVLDANAAVAAGDGAGAREAVARLERVDDERIEAATRLIDAYPELGGDLDRVR